MSHPAWNTPPPAPAAGSPPDWPALIVEGIEEVLFSLDHDWCFTYLNHQATVVLGQPRAALLGRVLWEQFPTLLGSSFEQVYRQAMAEGRPCSIEDYSSSSRAWFEVRAYPIPQGLIVWFRDISARKQLEQSLQESEARFKVLSSASFEGVVIHQHGVILEANQRAADMFGYAGLEEFLGQPVTRLIAPESLAEAQRHIAEDSSEVYEALALRKDGRRFPIESRGQTQLYQGEPARVIALRDISERKQAEAALRASEASLRALFESAAQAFILLDRDFRVTQWNQRAADGIVAQTGKRLALGAPITDYALEGTSAARLELLQRAAAGERASVTLDLSAPGRPFWLKVEYNPVYDSAGALMGVCISTLDITQQHQAMQALAASESRFRLLAEQARDIIYRYRFSPPHGFEYVSPAATAITGYTPEEHYADPELRARLVLPEDRARLPGPERPPDPAPLLLRWVRKDGGLIWIEQQNTPLYDAAGAVVAIEGIARDVSARMHAEQELRQAHQLLQSVAAEQRSFAQRLVAVQEAERAHLARELHDEVGQLLTGMNILLESALRSEHDGQRSRLAEAQTTLRDLTTLVRRMSVDLRPPMLDDLGLLATLRWHLDRYTAQTGILVRFQHRQLDQPLDAAVATAAYRIVQEALTNVARHAGVSQVDVQVWVAGGLLNVQVQDAGRGFDMDATRVTPASSGLSGMRERAVLLGGQWELVSAPGEGTQLHAALPLTPPAGAFRGGA